MSDKGLPPLSRTERKKEETKRKIIDIAVKLFKEQGFDTTTMEQIAREADIAKGTLYNYFPIKEAILGEFIRSSFKDKNSARILELRKLSDTRSRMIVILSELIKGVQSQKEIFEKYLIYETQKIISLHKDGGVKSGIRLLAAQIIELGQQSGEIRKDLSFDILADLFEFAFIEVAKLFYTDPDNFAASEAIEQCVDLFINGAKPR